jgi:V/A-type H+-transporting ATPase subunit D
MEINATRMELLRLRKRLNIAERGHKLLKQKQDELLRVIQDIIKKLSDMRRKIEDDLVKALKRFFIARAYQDKKSFESAFLLLDTDIELSLGWKKIMNVPLPEYKKDIKGELISYGFANTSPTMDKALRDLKSIFERLLILAEMEKSIALLSEEMAKTRRRVNALEYILIPELKNAVRYIFMKLAERERETISRLMRIKDIIRS